MLKSVLSALLFLISVAAGLAQPPLVAPCLQCHAQTLTGAHAGLACVSCHGMHGNLSNPAAMAHAAAGCVGCHPGTAQIFEQAMSTRQDEIAFCQRSWSQADPDFFDTNCMGCHVTRCLDCHGASGHAIERPDSEVCQQCHNGYYVGWDYAGRAPREDSVRYQRGAMAQGQHYLKMRPDVHFEAGMVCGDCHSMNSLQQGRPSSRRCVDCHQPDPQVIEHRVAAHLEKMECVSCHAAWSAQEYGTFYIQTRDSSNRDYFRVRKTTEHYVKSSYLKRQGLPVLGLNAQGQVSPIRPQFIAYFSAMANNQALGAENRLMAAEWKAYRPHTVRRGAPLCDSCHSAAQRFMLEEPGKQIYRPDLDGLGLESFWRAAGQRVVNGSFYPASRFQRLLNRERDYAKLYVEKWQSFLSNDGASSEQ